MQRLCSSVREIALFSSLVLLAASASAASATRPNIMLIIADDIGVDATSDMYPGLIDGLLKQYGPDGLNHPKYQEIKGRQASTPNLNALSKAGMRFTQAWVQPFCANTRASIISGLYPAKMGVIDYNGYLYKNAHSFVRDLKDKGGYATGVFGKYHIAGLNQYPGLMPKEAGFDVFRGNMTGAPATYWEWDYHVQDAGSPMDQFRTEKAPTRSVPGVAPTTYAPVATTADALAWIRESERQNPSRPWFAWVAYNLAHITANQQPNPMIVPNIDTLDEPSRKEMESCGGTFASANVGQCTDKQLMRAMTNSMDTLIGKLLQEVDTLDSNTYVIFIGDNGTWMFGARREFIDNMYITRVNRSKGTAYESGARVQLVVRGPNVRAGSSSDEPVSGVDLFSTVLTLAGLEVPQTVPDKSGRMVPPDAVSLTPALFRGTTGLRDPHLGYLLTETMNPVRQNMLHVAARNAKFKLVCAENAQTGSCEFYDLQRDPLEEFPLAKPDSCAKFASGEWKNSASEWNFCRLQEVLAKESILSQPRPAPAPARGAGPGRAAAPGGAAPPGRASGAGPAGPPPAR